MKDYLFPFSTCEKSNKKGIAQPWSVAVNVVSIFIIVYFLFQVKKWYSFLLIFSLLIFECVHTFSHAIHLSSYLQLNLLHSLTYVINICYLFAFYNITKKAASPLFLLYLATLVCADLYSFFFLSFMYYLTTALLIYFSILTYYYPYMPKEGRHYILIILALGLTIMGLFYNEKMNCDKMLSFMPHFPFHAVLEITGLFIFYFICKFFTLESPRYGTKVVWFRRVHLP